MAGPTSPHDPNAVFWSGKRSGSREQLMQLLVKAHIPFVTVRLGELTNRQWNELGEHAYYRANPNEGDYLKNRRVPEEILAFIKQNRSPECRRWKGRR